MIVHSLFILTGLMIISTNLTLSSLLPEGVPAAGRPMSHLACDCPVGYFSKGTLSIFTEADICHTNINTTKEKSSDLAISNGKTEIKLIPMDMKICQSCAIGCAQCLGPDENDCLKCIPGYLVNYYQIGTTIYDSTEATIIRRKRKTTKMKTKEDILKKIYEDEGLLMASSNITAPTSTPSTKSSISRRRRPPTNEKEESPFYVDDNFMSLESDVHSSGYIDENERKADSKIITNFTNSSQKLLSQSELEIQEPINQKDFEVVDYYGDIDQDEVDQHFVESLEEVPMTVPTIPFDAIQWHGSSPFSCVKKCPGDFYADEDGICQACHSECNGCAGNGPNHCLECRNFYQGSYCVSICNFDELDRNYVTNFTIVGSSRNCSFLGGNQLKIVGSRMSYGYYAIPPMIIMAIVFFGFLMYFRTRYRMQLNWPCTTKGRRTCRNSNGDHEDHKKCFLNLNKHRIPMDEIKLSTSPMRIRPGNAYVYKTDLKENSFLSTKDTDDDEFYGNGPLYETPDSSTWNSRCDNRKIKAVKHQFRRQSSTSTQCYLIPSDATTTTNAQRIMENNDDQGSKTSKTPVIENGVPRFEAPPLPSRNTPTPEVNRNNDHIYVNIDDFTQEDTATM